jgi:hypothetical protein
VAQRGERRLALAVGRGSAFADALRQHQQVGRGGCWALGCTLGAAGVRSCVVVWPGRPEAGRCMAGAERRCLARCAAGAAGTGAAQGRRRAGQAPVGQALPALPAGAAAGGSWRRGRRSRRRRQPRGSGGARGGARPAQGVLLPGGAGHGGRGSRGEPGGASLPAGACPACSPLAAVLACPGHSAAGWNADPAQGRPPPLFVYRRESGAYWYNCEMSPGPEAAQGYRFAGWLLAQSLANRAPLGCTLAPLLLQKLLLGDLFRVGRLLAAQAAAPAAVIPVSVVALQLFQLAHALPAHAGARPPLMVHGTAPSLRSLHAMTPLPYFPSSPPLSLTTALPCPRRSPAWRRWRRSTRRPPRPWRGWRGCRRSSTCSCWSWRAPPAAAPARSGWPQRGRPGRAFAHASCRRRQVPWCS